MKRIISRFFFLFVCLLGFLASASAQTTPTVYCPAVDTNTIIVTLDNAVPCKTSFVWRANGWKGYYNVYLSTTPDITATGTVATLVTNSTSVTLGDFGATVAQYQTNYYILVRLRNAQNGQDVAGLARYSPSPLVVNGGSGDINCAINGGIITNVVLTRVMPNIAVAPSVTCPSGLSYANLRTNGLDALNSIPLSTPISITWVGGPVDGLHPASATWTYLKNTFLFNRVTLGQLINIKSDTPVGGGVLCQPCIATPATFSYTLNEQTKKVPSIGYGTAANTLNPASGLVSDNNCVQVSATLQW